MKIYALWDTGDYYQDTLLALKTSEKALEALVDRLVKRKVLQRTWLVIEELESDRPDDKLLYRNK